VERKTRGFFRSPADQTDPKSHDDFVFVLDAHSHRQQEVGLMKTLEARTTTRLVAAMLVTVAVIGLSTLAMYQPTQNQNSVALKSIRC
jgi:hypothetical protein